MYADGLVESAGLNAHDLSLSAGMRIQIIYSILRVIYTECADARDTRVDIFPVHRAADARDRGLFVTAK